MAEATGIAWTDHTFNPWRGCAKVSEGCKNCYAEAMSSRNPKVLGVWGPDGTRPVAAESYWRQPLRWDRLAREEGRRHRVFCASLADVFEDRPDLDGPRQRLFDLVAQTPHLDWQLLTKRPEVMRDWLTGDGLMHAASGNVHAWGDGWPNVWLGVSVENQANLWRAKELLEIPAAHRFLSCEPLLGPVDLGECLYRYHGHPPKQWPCQGRIDWVIVGGESGPGSRVMELGWARSIVRQCRDAGCACFVKQLGLCASDARNGLAGAGLDVPAEAAPLISLRLRDRKGGSLDEFPADLRVREFPA